MNVRIKRLDIPAYLAFAKKKANELDALRVDNGMPAISRRYEFDGVIISVEASDTGKYVSVQGGVAYFGFGSSANGVAAINNKIDSWQWEKPPNPPPPAVTGIYAVGSGPPMYLFRGRDADGNDIAISVWVEKIPTTSTNDKTFDEWLDETVYALNIEGGGINVIEKPRLVFELAVNGDTRLNLYRDGGVYVEVNGKSSDHEVTIHRLAFVYWDFEKDEYVYNINPPVDIPYPAEWNPSTVNVVWMSFSPFSADAKTLLAVRSSAAELAAKDLERIVLGHYQGAAGKLKPLTFYMAFAADVDSFVNRAFDSYAKIKWDDTQNKFVCGRVVFVKNPIYLKDYIKDYFDFESEARYKYFTSQIAGRVYGKPLINNLGELNTYPYFESRPEPYLDISKDHFIVAAPSSAALKSKVGGVYGEDIEIKSPARKIKNEDTGRYDVVLSNKLRVYEGVSEKVADDALDYIRIQNEILLKLIKSEKV